MNSSTDHSTHAMCLLHSTSVTPEQIDLLGHMNVRFYGAHAMEGAKHLAHQIGLPIEAEDEASTARFIDLYTRHYHEQLEGSPLEVWGGVLDISEFAVRLYLELRNPEKDVLGATFVFTAQLVSSTTQEPHSLPDAVITAAASVTVEWPEHGQPRSLNLETEGRKLTLEEVEAINLTPREIRVVKDDQCDENGHFRVGGFQDLIWGNDSITDEDNDWLSTLENGDRMGWATMESRCSLLELPSAGTRVQSFWTTVDITRKAQQERFWVFDMDRNVLLCTAAFAEVAFNINTRRAIEIPEDHRASLQASCHPELA